MYQQLCDLVFDIVTNLGIECATLAETIENVNLCTSQIDSSWTSKIKKIMYDENIVGKNDCLETQFFRHITKEIEVGNEKCKIAYEKLVDTFVPHLALIFPIPDSLLNNPVKYITELPSEKKNNIALALDKIDYVLNHS